MWVLIDGRRMPKDIATEVGVTRQAVSYFLNAALAADLITYERGKPPRKILEYVPPDWVELMRLPSVEESDEKVTSQDKKTPPIRDVNMFEWTGEKDG
jgi:hypothetical protein